MKFSLIFFFWLMFPFRTSAQIDLSTQAFGAKSLGLGAAKLYNQDAWSLFNNVGSLDRIEDSEVGIALDQRYGIQELSTASLSLAFKKPGGSFGIGIARFGREFFQQHRLELGLSTTRGILSFGAKAAWFQTHIEGFGTGNALLLSLGGLAELGPRFFFGLHLSNLNQAKVSKQSSQPIPTLLTLGITYLPAKNLEIHSELEKDLDHTPLFKLGLQYQLENWIFLRTGYHSAPNSLHFGLGLRKNKYGLDYAIGETTGLGGTHLLSLFLKH
ncbi:MAG: hypothetical protein ACO22X_01735 [Algoriphagus sp.]